MTPARAAGDRGGLARAAAQLRDALENIGFLIAVNRRRFFYTPHIDWPIACLPTCRGPGNPPITYGEYRVWWLNSNYGTKPQYDRVAARRA